MNIKGGVSYVDYKGNNITTQSTYINGIYGMISKAYHSKKLTVLHNVKVDSETLCDIFVYSVRYRPNNASFVLGVAYTNVADSKIMLRYLVVAPSNSVTSFSAAIG